MAITRHVEWLMEGVESWNRRREERHFVPGLQKANLEGVDLSNVNLRGAQLRGAKLSNSNLSQSNLIGADLSRADLSNANLERATMTAAVVTNATLRGANLRYADISEIDLSRSDLSNTDMRNSFVLGANVKGTRFFNANVLSARSGHREHVDLSIVHGLVPGQLLEMNGDTGVVLPQGWAHPPTGQFWKLMQKLLATTQPERGSSSCPIPAAIGRWWSRWSR